MNKEKLEKFLREKINYYYKLIKTFATTIEKVTEIDFSNMMIRYLIYNTFLEKIGNGDFD